MQDNKHLLYSICFWNVSHEFISLAHNYLSNTARQRHTAQRSLSSAHVLAIKTNKNANLAWTYVRKNCVSFGLISDSGWYAPAADCAGLCAEIRCHFSLMCLVSSVLLWQNSDSRVIERELNIDTDIVTRERWVHSSSIDSSAVVFSLEPTDALLYEPLQQHRLARETAPITWFAQARCSVLYFNDSVQFWQFDVMNLMFLVTKEVLLDN